MRMSANRETDRGRAARRRCAAQLALLLSCCLPACSGKSARDDAAGEERGWQVPIWKTARPARMISLTGRYESGRPPSLSRLCIVAGRRAGRFGLVVRGQGQRSCSGSGRVMRDGGGLHFAMEGDSFCRFRATIAGTTIIFAGAMPRGCAYYCAAGAKLGGARFTQEGATRSDAMTVDDLVGEPLCAER